MHIIGDHNFKYTYSTHTHTVAYKETHYVYCHLDKYEYDLPPALSLHARKQQQVRKKVKEKKRKGGRRKDRMVREMSREQRGVTG